MSQRGGVLGLGLPPAGGQEVMLQKPLLGSWGLWALCSRPGLVQPERGGHRR